MRLCICAVPRAVPGAVMVTPSILSAQEHGLVSALGPREGAWAGLGTWSGVLSVQGLAAQVQSLESARREMEAMGVGRVHGRT